MFRILAFSDYRVHSLDALLKLIERLRSVDFMVYGGDDLERFFDFTKDEILNIFEYNIAQKYIPEDYHRVNFYLSHATFFIQKTGLILYSAP